MTPKSKKKLLLILKSSHVAICNHISINGLLHLKLNFICRLNYHIEVANAADVSKMEDDFAEEIKKRGDDFKFFQDQYGEHPDDRVVKNDEVTEKLADVQTLTQIFGGLKEKVY